MFSVVLLTGFGRGELFTLASGVEISGKKKRVEKALFEQQPRRGLEATLVLWNRGKYEHMSDVNGG